MTEEVHRRHWTMLAGTILYILGVVLALFLLLTVTTAQIETTLSEINSGTPTLTDTRESLKNIECPAAIGPDDSETIQFTATNPADAAQTAEFPVYAGSSESGYLSQCTPGASFGPSETRQLSCDVSATGISGKTLIVEVPDIQAHCGIAIINGPGGLDGMLALRVGFALSLIMLLIGAGMWFLRHLPHGSFEWLRGSLGIIVIIAIMVGTGFTLFVPDPYWKMVVSVFAFWGALLPMVGLLFLLAAEGVVMRWTARNE